MRFKLIIFIYIFAWNCMVLSSAYTGGGTFQIVYFSTSEHWMCCHCWLLNFTCIAVSVCGCRSEGDSSSSLPSPLHRSQSNGGFASDGQECPTVSENRHCNCRGLLPNMSPFRATKRLFCYTSWLFCHCDQLQGFIKGILNLIILVPACRSQIHRLVSNWTCHQEILTEHASPSDDMQERWHMCWYACTTKGSESVASWYYWIQLSHIIFPQSKCNLQYKTCVRRAPSKTHLSQCLAQARCRDDVCCPQTASICCQWIFPCNTAEWNKVDFIKPPN